MKTEVEPITFINTVAFAKLPEQPLSKFAIGSATPTVLNCEFWLCGGTVVTITNFLKGSSQQRLHILGDGLTTISNNTNIKTNTGANKLLAANKVYRFSYISSLWIEDA